MSCYNPIYMKYTGMENGKPQYKYTGVRAMTMSTNQKSHPKDIAVPCKKCIGCRLDYSKRWADRLMLELDHSITAVFVTLTYDDEHIHYASEPAADGTIWPTLNKRDLQLFNKRLRQRFSSKKIKFFACGEYGSKTLRPHMHAIYFGLSLDDFPDRKIKFFNKHKQPIYVSELLSDIWQHNGIVSIAPVSWHACAYVARYNLKKINFDSDEASRARHCEPEFLLMSRRPGIASNYLEDHPEWIENPLDSIFISDPHSCKDICKEIRSPDYFLRLIRDEHPDIYDEIKTLRKASAEMTKLNKLSKTSLNEYDYDGCMERSHGSRTHSLLREL